MISYFFKVSCNQLCPPSLFFLQLFLNELGYIPEL